MLIDVLKDDTNAMIVQEEENVWNIKEFQLAVVKTKLLELLMTCMNISSIPRRMLKK